jgi:circadian clock protein KaiC
MDAWLLVQNIESNGERNRGLYVLKSRGMAHSNQIREFVISEQGIDLVDAYVGPGGVLVGAARVAQTAREKAAVVVSRQEAQRARRTLARRHTAIEQQVAALRSDYEAEAQEVRGADERAFTRRSVLAADREELGRLRQADNGGAVGALDHATRRKGRR